MIIKENIKRLTRTLSILIALFLLLQFTACSNIGERADQLLSQITDYEFGQNRTKLMEFSDLVTEAAKSQSESEAVEESILKVLQKDATFASKQFMCRQLRIIGSEKSVPVLSKMLIDEKTTNIARYALEDIPGEKVDDALIQALDKGTKKVELGIITTLSVRKCKKAVEPIGKLLKSDDEDIALTAATALGNIKGTESIKYLAEELNTPNKKLQKAVADSYLRCADDLAEKNPTEANKMYSKLYKKDMPTAVKQGAFIGIINTSENKDKLLYDAILNGEGIIRYIAISKLRDLPSDYELTKFSKLLPKLSHENQIQLLGVIENRADKDSHKYVLQTLKSKEPLVRIASLNALAKIGNSNDVITIARIAANKSGDERRAARSCLDLLNNKNIDETIVESISKVDDPIKIELIRAIGTRGITSAFDILIKNIDSKNRQVRTAVYSAVAEVATNKELELLTEKLFSLPYKNDTKRLERTIAKVIERSPDENYANYLIKKFGLVNSVDSKSSILRLLGYTNNASALELLRKEIKSDDEKIKLAAIEGLSSWVTPVPLYDLLEATEKAESEKVKRAALKGFTNFVPQDKDLSDSLKIELFKKSLKFSKTSNEKNIALDGIGHIDNFASLAVLKQYYNDPSVKETVEDGINRVGWHVREEHPEEVKAFILDLMKITTDERYKEKSQQLINNIDKILKKKK